MPHHHFRPVSVRVEFQKFVKVQHISNIFSIPPFLALTKMSN